MEKKLTDEEWFEQYAKACKALEDGYCEQLAYGGTSDAQTEKEIEFDRRLIAYVRRLQDENAGLKEQVDEYFTKAYFYYQKCKAYGIEFFYNDEFEAKPAKEGKTIAFPKFKGEEVE